MVSGYQITTDQTGRHPISPAYEHQQYQSQKGFLSNFAN